MNNIRQKHKMTFKTAAVAFGIFCVSGALLPGCSSSPLSAIKGKRCTITYRTGTDHTASATGILKRYDSEWLLVVGEDPASNQILIARDLVQDIQFHD